MNHSLSGIVSWGVSKLLPGRLGSGLAAWGDSYQKVVTRNDEVHHVHWGPMQGSLDELNRGGASKAEMPKNWSWFATIHNAIYLWTPFGWIEVQPSNLWETKNHSWTPGYNIRVDTKFWLGGKHCQPTQPSWKLGKKCCGHNIVWLYSEPHTYKLEHPVATKILKFKPIALLYPVLHYSLLG